MTKDKIDYHFKAINNIEFEMLLTFKAHNKLFMQILEKSINKGDLKVNADKLKNVTTFELPKEYFKYIHAVMEKQLKPIYKELDNDSIIVKTAFPTRILFNRIGEKWNVEIKYEGLYNDIRP